MLGSESSQASSTKFGPAFIPSTGKDSYGEVREAIGTTSSTNASSSAQGLRQRSNAADQSVDFVTDLQYDFDWSKLQDPRKDIVKDYVQSYDIDAFSEHTPSEPGSVNTPSLVSDNGSDVEANHYLANTDIFYNIW